MLGIGEKILLEYPYTPEICLFVCKFPILLKIGVSSGILCYRISLEYCVMEFHQNFALWSSVKILCYGILLEFCVSEFCRKCFWNFFLEFRWNWATVFRITEFHILVEFRIPAEFRILAEFCLANSIFHILTVQNSAFRNIDFCKIGILL